MGKSDAFLKSSFFGIPVGSNVRCFGNVFLLRGPGSTISIGDNVSIVSSSPRCTAASIFAATKLQTHSESAAIILEEGVGLNGTSITARSKTIRIGRGTMIAPNVTIMDSDFHALWPPENRLLNPAFKEDKDVTIGENVWIGTGSIILKGVTIGNNSVIGAGSVVASSIPENVLACGVPARKIRDLS